MGTHEELLERVAVGELAPDAPEVQAAARSDAEFARELEETLKLTGELDMLGREREAVLADARTRGEAPGEAAVAEFVRARLAPAQERRGGRRRFLTAAAAVVLVGLFTWWLLPAGETELPDIPLSPTELRCTAPKGQVEAYDEFRWNGDPSSGWFEVEVFDVDGREVDGGSSGMVRGLSWRPAPEVAAGWPDAIEWEVRWFDGTGNDRESHFASASRRP